MSSKKRTPKNRKDDPLYKAVNELTQPKKKEPKRKQSKSRKRISGGGVTESETFLNKIQDMLFTMNHVDYNGIGISTTYTPLSGKKDDSHRTFTEVTKDKIYTSIPNTACNQTAGKPVRKNTSKQSQSPINKEAQEAGYGKKYINNHIRLTEEFEGMAPSVL